jgi:hypothetical protein
VNDVLCMPKTKKNVISIGVITNMGCVMVFCQISCWIMIVFTPHRIVAIGKRNVTNGLNKLTITILQKKSQNSPSLLMIEHHLNINLWHKRLGHIGFQGLH